MTELIILIFSPLAICIIGGVIVSLYEYLFPSFKVKKIKTKIEKLYTRIEDIQQSYILSEKYKKEICIPDNCEIDNSGLPKNKDAINNYGPDFTVYLTPTGYKFHVKPHCSPNSYVSNIANAVGFYKPCLVCCNNYTVPDLTWYNVYRNYTKEQNKIDSLISDYDKQKFEIEKERKVLNKRRYQFMLNHMPKTNFELKRIDSILNKDIENYCVPNIQKKEKLDVQRSEQTNEYVTPSVIPASIALDSNDLPYIKLREYGYGKKFNAFVTERSDCYHRSKCSAIRFHKKKVIHRYEALKKYRPCTICKPIDYVDDWYKTYMSEKSNQKTENTEFSKASISIPPVLNIDAEVQAKLNELVEKYQKEKQK